MMQHKTKHNFDHRKHDADCELKENISTHYMSADSSSKLTDRENLLQRLIEKIDDFLTESNHSGQRFINADSLISVRNLFIIYLLNNSDLKIENYSPIVNKKDQLFLDRFNKLLEKYYHDHSLNLNTIADKLAMSHRQVQRKLKNITGFNPIEYLRSFRIEKATFLLLKGNSVEDVAYDVGFATRNYFGICFKEKMGVNPKQYQQML